MNTNMFLALAFILCEATTRTGHVVWNGLQKRDGTLHLYNRSKYENMGIQNKLVCSKQLMKQNIYLRFIN